MNLNQSGHLPYGVWHEVAKEPWPVPQKEEIPFLWCAIRYCDNSLGYGIYQYDFENHNWKVAWKNRDISLDSIVAWSRLLKHDYVPASLSDTMKNVLKIVKKHGYIFRNHAGLWTYPDCPINRTAEGKEYLEWSCQTGTLLALQNRGLITIKDERAFLNDGSGGKYYG